VSGRGFGAEWSARRARGSREERLAWLAFALESAAAADDISRRWFRRDVEVKAKPDRSLVTAADTEIERLIRERIADRFPAHGVVGEEYGEEHGSAESRWYLDPIDATANFVRGVPAFGTLIALEVDGELQVGVVSMPAMGEVWWAGRGLGAWTRGPDGRQRSIATSAITGLADTHLLFGEANQLLHRAPGFAGLLDDVWRSRGFGDCWMYCLLAEGTAEAVLEADLSAWDLAGPVTIVEEAGGRFTDLTGSRTIHGRSAVATNGHLHDVILERLHRGRSDDG
jgi:histidinol-phosphatase